MGKNLKEDIAYYWTNTVAGREAVISRFLPIGKNSASAIPKSVSLNTFRCVQDFVQLDR